MKVRSFQKLSRRWILSCLPTLLIFAPVWMLGQQEELAGRVMPNFKLNFLRSEGISPHGQQPPYEWSAVYVRNAFAELIGSESYVLDSSVCGMGVVNSQDFGEEIKVDYQYNGDGTLSGVLYRQEIAPGVYVDFSRKTFTYVNGQRTGYRYQKYFPGTGFWRDDYEEATTYTASGKQATFMIRETDGGGNWVNLLKETRNYDNDGNLVAVLSAKWDNGAWLDTARKEIRYNSVGSYTDIYDESWNGTGWDTLSVEKAFYGNLGFTWEAYLFARNTPGGFVPEIRETYSYDQDGYWVGLIREMRDSTGTAWVKDIQEVYDYTKRGLWTGWTQQAWQDTGWVNFRRQQYSKLGPTGRQEIMQIWDSTLQAWENGFRALAQYDSSFNLVAEAGIQAWDGNISEWENTQETRACEHFYSPASATSLVPDLPQLNCNLSNPYRAYEPFYCESLQPGQNYDLRLLDMQGRTVYQQLIPGGAPFSIDRTLPAGVYNLSIFEDQQLQFVRKIIIQN